MKESFPNSSQKFPDKRPPFTMFPMSTLDISDEDYIHMAINVARQSGARWNIDETEERYRFDMYLSETVVMGAHSLDWVRLIEGCDLYTMDLNEKAPQTIRASFFRNKHK